ncbi:hypothetical protein P8452_26356 [Trifolium repens]|nr:hypothetical protein P8452_26356 [Trifolium repens]
MARKRKAQTEIVPDEVPPAPTQEAQNTLNETPLENQDAEAAVEPTVRPSKSKEMETKGTSKFDNYVHIMVNIR